MNAYSQFFLKNHRPAGPYPLHTVAEMWKRHDLRVDERCAAPGSDNWVPVADLVKQCEMGNVSRRWLFWERWQAGASWLCGVVGAVLLVAGLFVMVWTAHVEVLVAGAVCWGFWVGFGIWSAVERLIADGQ